MPSVSFEAKRYKLVFVRFPKTEHDDARVMVELREKRKIMNCKTIKKCIKMNEKKEKERVFQMEFLIEIKPQVKEKIREELVYESVFQIQKNY